MIMNKIREKFAQFMVGRYGVDQLNYALMVLYLVCFVLSMMFKETIIFSLLMWGLLFYSFFRMFSRNVYNRSQENESFLEVWNKIKGFFQLNFSKIRDFRTKKYVKCPHCKAVLRLPRQRGNHTVRCPKCNDKFNIKIIIGSKSHNSAENKRV